MDLDINEIMAAVENGSGKIEESGDNTEAL